MNWKSGDKGCRLDLNDYSSLLSGSLESERIQGLHPAGFGSGVLRVVCWLVWCVCVVSGGGFGVHLPVDGMCRDGVPG